AGWPSAHSQALARITAAAADRARNRRSGGGEPFLRPARLGGDGVDDCRKALAVVGPFALSGAFNAACNWKQNLFDVVAARLARAAANRGGLRRAPAAA